MARAARTDPPTGLKAPWRAVWRAAQRNLDTEGVWSPALRPLLDEYVEALRRARELRPPAGADSANTGFVAADRESRRAVAIATALGLTPKRPVGRPRKEKQPSADEKKTTNPFEELDELAPRRAQRKDRP